jgi:hypothetical protein
MSIHRFIHSYFGFLFFFLLSFSSSSAHADFVQLNEVFGEVRGGYYLTESFHHSLLPDQIQRVIQLFQIPSQGWNVVTHPPEFTGDSTHFRFVMKPELLPSGTKVHEATQDKSNTKEVRSEYSQKIDDFDSAEEIYMAFDLLDLQGWSGAWGVAKGMVSGAKTLACSAAKAVGNYATQALCMRTIAGTVTQEKVSCPAPFASQGTRFVFHLGSSDPIVSSVLSGFALHVCHDEVKFKEQGRIVVRMGIEVEHGMAYSTLVDEEAVISQSEQFAISWFKSFQLLVDENEVKIAHQNLADE